MLPRVFFGTAFLTLIAASCSDPVIVPTDGAVDATSDVIPVSDGSWDAKTDAADATTDTSTDAVTLDAPIDGPVDGPPDSPPDASTDANPTSEFVALVFAGSDHTCVTFSDAKLKCWGLNDFGQLGLGTSGNRGDAPLEMGKNLDYVNLGTGRKVIYATAGSLFNCAILDNKTLKCWGNNSAGQLGLGDTVSRGLMSAQMGDALGAVSLGTGRSPQSIAAGSSHACAILDNGQVKCWGANDKGQLGLGDTTARGDSAGQLGDALPAVNLGTGYTAVAIAAGGNTTCAILSKGSNTQTVKCWGENDKGQLGLGDTNNRGDNAGEMGDSLPEVNVGSTEIKQLAVGGHHVCARIFNDRIKCWGSSSNGQLGLGAKDSMGDGAGEMGAALPTLDFGGGSVVLGGYGSVWISAGSNHTCGRIGMGAAGSSELKCWGYGAYGQLGHESLTALGDGPGEMGDALKFVSLGASVGPIAIVVAGDSHACARLASGKVKCWGRNAYGQLGLGDTANRGDNTNEMGDNLPFVDLGI